MANLRAPRRQIRLRWGRTGHTTQEAAFTDRRIPNRPIADDLGRDIGQPRLRNAYRYSPGHANDTLKRSLNVIPTAGEYRSGT